MSCFYRTSQQTRSLKSSSVLGRFHVRRYGGVCLCDSRNAILGSPCSMGVALNIRIFRADTEISSLMSLLLFLQCFILLGCANLLSNNNKKSIFFLYRNIVSINICELSFSFLNISEHDSNLAKTKLHFAQGNDSLSAGSWKIHFFTACSPDPLAPLLNPQFVWRMTSSALIYSCAFKSYYHCTISLQVHL